MWFFSKKKVEDDSSNWQNLDMYLRNSFGGVRQDTTRIFQWLNYLYQQNQQQDLTIKHLQSELSYMPKTKEQFKTILDEYYSTQSVIHQIDELKSRVNYLITENRHMPSRLDELKSRIDVLEQKKTAIKSSFKEKLIKNITRNSKDYIRSTILSLIKKYERISALKLKDIVVEEQALCSKSSFYRMLIEIEEMEEITVIKEGKEKLYVVKTIKNM